jgi:AcrR family transcriptional regulator
MKSPGGTRTYESPLREEQLEQTRERILDAAERVLVAQDGALSIPAVAREASVSIPTVYRHFGTKDELLGALAHHFVARLAGRTTPPPGDLDGLWAFLVELVADFEQREPALRVAMSTPAGQQARREFMPRRRELIAAGLEPLLAGVGDDDRRLIGDLFLLMTSSAGYRAAKDYLGYSTDEIVETIVWLVDTLARGSRTKNRNRKERKR